MNIGKNMNAKATAELFQALETRFEKNPHRHAGIAWADVKAAGQPTLCP